MYEALVGLLAAAGIAIVAWLNQRHKTQAARELEAVRGEIARLKEASDTRRQYGIPLLRVSEELYNKINDIVRNRDRVLGYFHGLGDRLGSVKSLGDILGSAQLTYLTTMLYQFSQFWAATVAIKRDVGLIEFSSAEQTSTFHLRLRQVLSVFPSGRLHEGLTIKRPDRLKYEGRILSGAVTMIAESVLLDDRDGLEFISLRTFCQRLASEPDFLAGLSPLVQFLEGLVEINEYEDVDTDIDFRWAKLILFAKYLRELIRVFDDTKSIALLPDLEGYERDFIGSNPPLADGIASFERAYPSQVSAGAGLRSGADDRVAGG